MITYYECEGEHRLWATGHIQLVSSKFLFSLFLAVPSFFCSCPLLPLPGPIVLILLHQQSPYHSIHISSLTHTSTHAHASIFEGRKCKTHCIYYQNFKNRIRYRFLKKKNARNSNLYEN